MKLSQESFRGKKEHLEILLEAIKQENPSIWNDWRILNPMEQPILIGVNLAGVVLPGINFLRADLSQANLCNAGLFSAFMQEAILNNVNAKEALLQGANIKNCKIKDGVFIKANFMGADFSGSFFENVNLQSVNAASSMFKNTICKNVNLNNANFINANFSDVALETCELSDTKFIGALLNNLHMTQSTAISVDFSYSAMEKGQISKSNLSKGNFRGAFLMGIEISDTILEETDFSGANFSNATMKNAILCGNKLRLANLNFADFSGADLTGADLSGTQMVSTNLDNAILRGAFVHGISPWEVSLEGTNQNSLVISKISEPLITVDYIEVAQFIYLILKNKRIREAIDSISSKAVLILGRFTPERKAVLEAVGNKLRENNFLPILFDFDKPQSLNLTETVVTLARMSKFIVADITEASSIPQELMAIVPTTVIPIKPIIHSSKKEYAMFNDFKVYPWMLDLYRYSSIEELIFSLREKIIVPAEAKEQELVKIKISKKYKWQIGSI